MIDVIVYKPSPYGLVFINNKLFWFIIYHIKQKQVYVSYIFPYLKSLNPVPLSAGQHDADRG